MLLLHFCPFCPRLEVWNPFPLPAPCPNLFLRLFTIFANFILFFPSSFHIRNFFKSHNCCINVSYLILCSQNLSTYISNSCCFHNNSDWSSCYKSASFRCWFMKNFCSSVFFSYLKWNRCSF